MTVRRASRHHQLAGGLARGSRLAVIEPGFR